MEAPTLALMTLLTYLVGVGFAILVTVKRDPDSGLGRVIYYYSMVACVVGFVAALLFVMALRCAGKTRGYLATILIYDLAGFMFSAGGVLAFMHWLHVAFAWAIGFVVGAGVLFVVFVCLALSVIYRLHRYEVDRYLSEMCMAEQLRREGRADCV